MNKLRFIYAFIVLAVVITGCASSGDKMEPDVMVFGSGTYPNVIKEGDTYYYMMPMSPGGRLSIFSAKDPAMLGKTDPVVVWRTDAAGFQNVWSPELHRIGGKWYIYFEADDGNTDNHHVYVLENASPDPTKGVWELHGPVMLNEEWNYGIHPSTFEAGGRRYLIWSGWEKRRTETETQCIFIAEMGNPWTLKSSRVLISRPSYEWERQWINPDGSRSAYPIFVNENPEACISPDGRHVVIVYSASGIWTVYNTLGMLHASVSSDLLNPSSWQKMPEPVMTHSSDSKLIGVSNITLAPDVDGKGTVMLYQGKLREDAGKNVVMLRHIIWDGDSVPVFGTY